MTIVDMLLEQLERDGGVSSVVARDAYTLRIVAGRPGAVCFTLQQEVSQGLTVILAEGFTLEDQLVYDQRSLSTAATEQILAMLIGTQAPLATTAPIRFVPTVGQAAEMQ